jgi:hypothetical protein
MNKLLYNLPDRNNQNKNVHNNIAKQNNLIQFNNNRKESTTLRNLQQNINNSEKVLSLKRISNTINNTDPVQLKIEACKWNMIKKGELVMEKGKLVQSSKEKKLDLEIRKDDKYEYVEGLINNQDSANLVREIFPKNERGDITKKMKTDLETHFKTNNELQFHDSYKIREDKNALNCTLDMSYNNDILDLNEICCNPALYNDNKEVTRIDPYADTLVKMVLEIKSNQSDLIVKNALISSLINIEAKEGLKDTIMKLNNFNTPFDALNSIFNNPKYLEYSNQKKDNISTGNIEIKVNNPSDEVLNAINKGPVRVLKSINHKFILKSIGLTLYDYEFNEKEKKFSAIKELKCYDLKFETKNEK